MKQVHKDDICVVTRSEVDVNRYYGRGNKNKLNFPMLKFQDSSEVINENGFTLEGVIACTIDRLEHFNTGQFKCDHNDRALEHLRGALKELNDRVEDRKARNVYNTDKA
ncbi:hypothetical protein AVP1_0189 [Aeromonas phage AVP1]|nr:hypothetical protein AVP1_0189 [Aeromonas phage AVP1]